MAAPRSLGLLEVKGSEEVRSFSSVAPKATARAITMNFITGGLGSAIFSLPWSVAGTSIINSIVIIGLVLLVNAWTISIVVRAAEKHQVFDLGAVIGKLPGRLGQPLQFITNIFVWLAMFLCLVSYIIVIHDSALTFVQGTWFESRVILVSLASLVVLPLCFMSQSVLEKTSALAISVNVYLFILIGFLYASKSSSDSLPDDCCILGTTVRGNFAMASVMFQAVIIQMCVLPMYEELEDRSPKKFDRIVAVGFGTLFFIFCGFSVVAYLVMGPGVSSNVLQDLPKGVGSMVAQAGVMVVVACVYPIMVYPMIAPILGGEERVLGMPRGLVVVVAKIMIVLAAMVCANFVTSLGIVNVINGAVSSGLFVALIPSVLGFVMLEPGPCLKLALSMLLVGGLVVAVMGLKFSDNYVSDLACSIAA